MCREAARVLDMAADEEEEAGEAGIGAADVKVRCCAAMQLTGCSHGIAPRVFSLHQVGAAGLDNKGADSPAALACPPCSPQAWGASASPASTRRRLAAAGARRGMRTRTGGMPAPPRAPRATAAAARRPSGKSRSASRRRRNRREVRSLCCPAAGCNTGSCCGAGQGRLMLLLTAANALKES